MNLLQIVKTKVCLLLTLYIRHLFKEHIHASDKLLKTSFPPTLLWIVIVVNGRKNQSARTNVTRKIALTKRRETI